MSVDCKLPAEDVERSFGSWQATIGGGDGPRSSIRFDTVNGRLYIDGSAKGPQPPAEPVVVKSKAAPEPTPPPAPEPPADPVETTSQTDILRMVERGEISVDEAIAMLQDRE
jgi:hypothetical protein